MADNASFCFGPAAYAAALMSLTGIAHESGADLIVTVPMEMVCENFVDKTFFGLTLDVY